MSGWTILDFSFLLIILISTGFALTKGLMREIISLVALIGGFVLAAFYYSRAGALFAELARTEAIANLFGFLLIFLGTLLAGAIAAYLFNRFVKMASLEWIDRVLGGIYGFLRGWMVASILVLALVAFPIRENAVANSALAPYLLTGARVAVLLVPQDLKDKFRTEYQKVMQALNGQRATV
jgi:membrane protein required for colicin V production